jgi:sporulation protein YlmC with PRC-barrel domain
MEMKMIQYVSHSPSRVAAGHCVGQQTPLSRAVLPLLGATAAVFLMTIVGAGAQQTPTVQSETGTAGSMQQLAPLDSVSEVGSNEDVVPAPIAVAGQIVEQEAQTYAASNVLGTDVASANGEYIGEVVDLLLTEDNQVAGVIVGMGGILGFGEKKIAVEMTRVNLAWAPSGEQRIVMNYAPAELEQAPEFVSLAAQERAEQRKQARLLQEQALQDATTPNAGTGVVQQKQ